MNRQEVATPASVAGRPGSAEQTENGDVTVPMMSPNHFIDAKVSKILYKLTNRWEMSKATAVGISVAKICCFLTKSVYF